MRYIIEHTGKYIQLRADEKSGWEWVSRMQNKDIVSIMAITKDNKLILVEQFRIPVNSRVIESPAGLVDEGESLLDAAKRELLEETGYTSDNWKVLYENAPNSAGLTNETTNKYLATDCIKVEEGGGLKHEGEDITVHLVPIDVVPKFLADKQSDGIMISPKVMAGLYLWMVNDKQGE